MGREFMMMEELRSALDHEECVVVEEGQECWGMVRWFIARKK